MEVRGKRVTVMGLGRHGGVAAARFLARRGAWVTVTDTAGEEELSVSIEALADVPIARFSLGRHREEDFLSADVVVVNPAVRPGDRFVELARRSGVHVTSEVELFLEACPARVVGVTGSNGKSTTAAMIAAILSADSRRVWLGGNIGVSLLDRLPRIALEDDVVLELSSFQLAGLSAAVPAPDVAVVTNCTANHLDWHGDMQAYESAKQRILLGQPNNSMALLNTNDPRLGSWLSLVRGTVVSPLADDEVPLLAVPGNHNRINAACAAGVCAAMGCSQAAIDAGLMSFRGLPHRLEWIADCQGRSFYNDSQATTPESVMAALCSFDRPLWLLAGGHDKGTDFKALAETIVKMARGAAFYGRSRSTLKEAVLSAPSQMPCHTVEHMEDALAWCWDRSEPGDVILLSPACASYDQFRDYAHRAETFRELVEGLTLQGAR